MPLTQAQFKARFAELGEYDKKQVSEFFDILGELISEVVGAADKAVIPAIGTLNCTVRESRKARNPATGETIKTKPKVGVRLSLSKAVKDAVPSIKKGRSLIEKRESAKATSSRATPKKSGLKSKTTTGAKRGRPKGSGKKKSRV